MQQDIDEDDEGNQPSDSFNDLKKMYRKMLTWAIIVTLLCIFGLIVAIVQDFYEWRGVVFNTIVIIACVFGICCSINYDHKSERHCIFKLKLLLIYFVIVVVLTVIIFGVFIAYSIIIPIRFNDEYETLTLIASTSMYIFCILLWLIFVCFYIDLVGRACLKRGRIDYYILKLIKNNNHEINKKLVWFKLYNFVLCYRKNFRKIRKCFTRFTLIRCVFDKSKEDGKNNKETEEARVIAMLQEGQRNIDYDNYNTNCGSKCCYCLLYPFICCYKGILIVATKCITSCKVCSTACDCSDCDAKNLMWKVLGYLCIWICILGLIYVMMPWVLLVLSVGIAYGIFLLLLLPILYCSGQEIYYQTSGSYAIGVVVFCGGCVIFYYLYMVWICPRDIGFKLDNDLNTWSLQEQCSMWACVFDLPIGIVLYFLL